MGANILMGAIILRFKFKTKTIKMNKNLKVVSYADPGQWLKPSFAPHPTFFLKRVVHALRNFLEVNDVDLEDVDVDLDDVDLEDVDVAHLVELDHQVLLLLSCLQALPGDQLTVTLISSHLSSICQLIVTFMINLASIYQLIVTLISSHL